MRFNVAARQVGRVPEAPSLVGVILQVESDSPHGAAAEADAWVREHADQNFNLQQLIPRGIELVMEVYDPAERGTPGT